MYLKLPDPGLFPGALCIPAALKEGVQHNETNYQQRYPALFWPKNSRNCLLMMKLTAMILLAACLAASAGGNAQRITLSEKKAPLEKIFAEIKRQTGYAFLYSTEVLRQARRVDVEVRNVTLHQALKACFLNQPLTWELEDKTIIVKPYSPPALPGETIKEVIPPPAPLIDVKGRVVDEEGKPVAGASVQVKGAAGKGVSTNAEGYFELKGLDENVVLVISGVNIESREAKVSGKTILGDVVVKVKVEEGEEVVLVNTGYQQLPKERATGSFEKIDNKLLNRSTGTNIVNRLEGVSSMFFDNRNGIGSSKLSIRGRSTIMANATPLIIVDGFPYEGDVESLNPNDIADVTLLKDAAAASIWGARAANGVLVIETRQGGKNGRGEVEFVSNFTYGTKPDLYYDPAMSAKDFIEVEKFLFDKGYYNSTLSNIRYPIVSPAVELLAAHRGGSISKGEMDIQMAILESQDVRQDLGKYFYQNSLNQQYSLSYRGGSKKYSYSHSAGWDNGQASERRNTSSRLSLSSSNNFMPFKNLRIQSNLFYTLRNTARNNSVNNLRPGGKNLYPYARLVDTDGSALPIINGFRLGFTDTAGNGRLLDWTYRPLDELYLADNTTISHNLRTNTSINYNILPGFDAMLKYQYESGIGTGRNLSSIETYAARDQINRFTRINGAVISYGIPPGGILDQSLSNLSAHSGRAQLNYNKTWGKKHTLNVLGGSEIRETINKGHNYRFYGYDDNTLTYGNVNDVDLLPTYNNIGGNVRIVNPTNFSFLRNRFTSFYSNASYSLLHRYMLSASIRKDASNLFGVRSNQKGVPLWSVGMSWRVDEESFFKTNALSLLKLRLTYGYSGNVDNTASALTTLTIYSNSVMTGYQYARVSNPGNPELRWERSAMLNGGVDFAFQNVSLHGSIDFYARRGSDLLGIAPIDPTTGVVYSGGGFAYKGNVANMKSHGVDADLHFSTRGSVWNWNADLIFGYAKNQVTRYYPLSTRAYSYVGFGHLVSPIEGQPVYSIISYPWAGLDPQNGDPQGWLNGEVSKNYTGIRNAEHATLVYHGSAVPTSFGSILNTISYKKVSISANIMYKLGYYFRRSAISYGSLFSNWVQHADYAKRWQKPGDEMNTDVPSLVYPNVSNRDGFFMNATPYVERGDHIRLQDIRISYSLNESRRIHSGQFFIYIRNLGLLWKANASGLDPDNYNGGIPPVTTYALGFNLKLKS